MKKLLFLFLLFAMPATASAEAASYTVKRGDTLSGIAKAFLHNANLYPTIAKANGILNPDLILVGQVLAIPELSVSKQPGVPKNSDDNRLAGHQDVHQAGNAKAASMPEPAIARVTDIASAKLKPSGFGLPTMLPEANDLEWVMRNGMYVLVPMNSSVGKPAHKTNSRTLPELTSSETFVKKTVKAKSAIPQLPPANDYRWVERGGLLVLAYDRPGRNSRPKSRDIKSLERLEIERQIAEIFKEHAPLMTAVFRAESGLRCDAVGDRHLTFRKGGVTYGKSYGIAQIRHLPGRPSPEELMDCTSNLLFAKQTFDSEGLNAWSAYRNRSYRKYLASYSGSSD